MKLKGSIKQIKAHISTSGDTVQTLSLEVFGDFASLHELLQKPLTISLEECDQ